MFQVITCSDEEVRETMREYDIHVRPLIITKSEGNPFFLPFKGNKIIDGSHYITAYMEHHFDLKMGSTALRALNNTWAHDLCKKGKLYNMACVSSNTFAGLITHEQLMSIYNITGHTEKTAEEFYVKSAM